MNQGFRLRFDQMRDGNPTEASEAQKSDAHEFYISPSQSRNLCMVWPDGRRLFLNYAYLVAAEFQLEPDQNVITLTFTSHTVLLHGYGLYSLYMALFDHLPRIISAVDLRYSATEQQETEVVIKIYVLAKDS